MKFLTIIFVINFLSFASSQNCSGVDYKNITLIVNALTTVFNETQSIINLISNVYMYTGYSFYWSENEGMNLNMFGNNFAYTSGNATASLLAIFRNFSLAISNTSANSNQSLIDLQMLIQQTNIMLMPLSSDDGNYPMQLSTDIKAQLMNIYGFIANLLNNVNPLNYAGLLPSASNILRVLPSPLLVEGLIRSLQNVTNAYIAYLNTSIAKVNNLYNIFKSSDPTLKTFDLMKNQTYYNWTLIANTTQGSINSTIANFTKLANTMYKNYITQLPAALKNNADFQGYLEGGQSMLAYFNDSLQSFQDQVAQQFDNIRMYIESYNMQFQWGIMQMIGNYRSQIFSNYQMNSTTLNCSITMLNKSEALWKTFGGPSNFFNCSKTDVGVLPKILPLFQVFFSTLNQDLDSALINIQRCLNVKNLTSDYSMGGMPYSMQQCISNNGMSLSMFSSSFSQFSGGFIQLIQGIVNNGNSRIQSCFMDLVYYNLFYAVYYPVVDEFQMCVYNKTSIPR